MTAAEAGEERCRWCTLHVGRDQSRAAGQHGRLVHVGSGEAFCADGRHVAELPPAPQATPKAQCRLCRGWFAIADVVEHWAACTGPAVDATKRARR